MTTEKSDTCDSLTCFCGRQVMVGVNPSTGDASVLHGQPPCDEYLHTDAEAFVAKLRASQKPLTE